jgi:hypothetical protein
MRELPRDYEELERLARIRRTVRAAPTRSDVENLTRRRLRGPFWRFKRR